MKKAISLIIIFIIFLIIYFLQSNFFCWFNIAGVKPNLFIIFMVFIGAFINKYYGFTIGVIGGLLVDLFVGKVIGLNAISFGIAGLIGGFLTKNVSKDSKISMIMLGVLTTLVCELIYYAYEIILLGMQIEIINFLRIILIEILYNSILLIILYPLLRKMGDKLEKVFTEDKILTRYY